MKVLDMMRNIMVVNPRINKLLVGLKVVKLWVILKPGLVAFKPYTKSSL